MHPHKEQIEQGESQNINNPPRVALVKCSSYSMGLREAIGRLLSELGGIGAFVKPGQSVLIKPNLLTDASPAQAITTHPEVVRALLQAFKAHGAEPFVADSPANAVKIEQVWERTGFRAMCAEENVPLMNLEKAGSVAFNVNGCSFSIARPVLDADVIVSVPKVKTHLLTILTAAVKNTYGTVPGFQKSNLHKLHPTPRAFGRLIAEIYKKVRPGLNIADAVMAMEGNGPSAGRPVRLGFLAASRDAVSLDLVLCRALRINPRAVHYLHYLAGNGGKRIEWRDIKIAGDSLDEISPRSFRSPSTLPGRLIPGGLVRILQPFLRIRPSVSDACVHCGRCIEACPVNALTLSAGSCGQEKQKPVLDAKKCIECCCCHEVCPEKAISMVQSPLLNLIRGRKI